MYKYFISVNYGSLVFGADRFVQEKVTWRERHVGLSMILYTIIRKEFNGRKPAQRTHRTMIRLSEMDF